MTTDSVLVELNENGVATLTLNRPMRHNAFDDELIARLQQHLDLLATNPHCRAVLLTASGKSFCAGADLNWMKEMAGYSKKENEADALKLATLLQTLNQFPRPTIALVQGNAFGGGVGLLACCDIVVATPSVKFSFSEVKLGLVPAVISPFVLAAIGSRAARRYFLTGEQFDADAAVAMQLVHLITPEDELKAAAQQLITQICQNGPEAMGQTKALLHYLEDARDSKAVTTHTVKLIAKIRASTEGQHGLEAFLSKQRADWIR